MISQIIKIRIKEALERFDLPKIHFSVELTKDLGHGDLASNIALVLGRQTSKNPKELAEQIAKQIGIDPKGYIDRVEAADAGFVNFWLSAKYYNDISLQIFEQKEKFGWNDSLSGQKIIVEYTDPNVLKPFHIGHLMSNAIGECLSRLYQASGAEVSRWNYFSDVGLNLAMAVYGMRERRETIPEESAALAEKTRWLGESYVFGVAEYQKNEEVKKEVEQINKIIYNKEPGEIWDLYQTGRRWSLAHFDDLYRRLGSHFDYFVPESEVAEAGLAVIREHRELFADSAGAVVFVGEPYGLHTRVFINSQGLSTYEAKELGLAKKKMELVNPDVSVVLTGNEQNDYFKVVMKVVDLCLPDFAGRTRHIGHGMLRFASGKMSSRLGNVITGEELIAQATEKARANEAVAIGAIKYCILRQAPGRDILFDPEKSLSLEGDSGPYIQYAYTRARSVLARANLDISKLRDLGISKYPDIQISKLESTLFRLIGRFPEIVRIAAEELAPQILCTYLIELAACFHHFYATSRIADAPAEEERARRLSLTSATAQVIQNSLWLLGISTTEKM